MGLAVVTVASGGLPIVETTSGTPVTEAAKGVPVTKVVGKPGLPVTFETIGVGSGTPPAIFDSAAAGVTLSNGGRTATHTNTTAGVGARSSVLKSSGKFYLEITATTFHGDSDIVGLLLSTGTYANMNGGTNCTAAFLIFAGSAIYSNNVAGNNVGGAMQQGDTLRIAVDLTARKGWFSRANTGIWNNDGSMNPATGVGGVTIAAAGSFGVAVAFGTGSTIGDNVTINCGQVAYLYAVPSGFGNWA